MPAVPFKANAKCRHHIPRQKRRVTNWPAYEASLCQRGDLTVWFSEEAITAWRAAPRTSRGGQPWYSPLAIVTALTPRSVFRLALRQTEGLIGSIMRLLGLDLPVPDHTTPSRRAEGLDVPRPRSSPDTEAMHLIVKSTGLKFRGPGEWLVEKHGAKTRRSWRKLHVGLDADTGRIVAAELTRKETDDGSQAGALLDRIAGPLASFTGDAACDSNDVYVAVAERHPGAAVILPPRSTSVPSEATETEPTQRDLHLRGIPRHGRIGWQKASGYNKRSRVEAAIGRFKQVIGDGLRSRTDARQDTKIAIAIHVLNRMLAFGRPESVRVM
jgi:hypothetical protein